MAAGGAAALLTLTGCGGASGGGGSTQPVIYALSGRGRRISNAAKSHNANMWFASAADALANRAHPGDTSKVVTIDTTKSFYDSLFGDGTRMVDRRRL